MASPSVLFPLWDPCDHTGSSGVIYPSQTQVLSKLNAPLSGNMTYSQAPEMKTHTSWEWEHYSSYHQPINYLLLHITLPQKLVCSWQHLSQYLSGPGIWVQLNWALWSRVSQVATKVFTGDAVVSRFGWAQLDQICGYRQSSVSCGLVARARHVDHLLGGSSQHSGWPPQSEQSRGETEREGANDKSQSIV